jgi:DNA-binding CsgD family transcriptional regulator
MPQQLIGREEELDAVVQLLDRRDLLPGTIVLHGQAGIGKTSLWLAGIDAASSRCSRTLFCRTFESETTFSYAGLADLLGAVADDVLSELPPIQRRALETALLLGESETHVEERAVAAAFLAALRLLAADGTLCLAVDDVQWLDAASHAAVRFALSRLDDEPIATLLTVRGAPPAWLRRNLSETRLVTVELDGLSIGALHELFRSRLDVNFPRPTLVRLSETSGGNPFFALELADALRRRGSALAPGEALPIPSTVDELLRERLRGLGTSTIEVARVVAAVGEATVDVVEGVLGDRCEAALAEALDAKILERAGTHLRFTHPLLGSAVAARQSSAHRRSLHRRLATVVPTAEERARHLALATTEPNGEIAATLEDAARSAQARGAPATAAELAEHAFRLTPETDVSGARRRLFLAAASHHVAGDADRAIVLLVGARAEAAPGVERASVLVRLAAVQADPHDAEALYHEALAESDEDDALEATTHLGLAALMQWGDGVERGLAHSEQAASAASRTDDVALRCRALAVYGDWQLRAGRGIARAEMDEAVALERTLPDAPLREGPTWVYCHQLVWSVELDAARKFAVELQGAFAARDDAWAESFALWELGLLEWRAGNWGEGQRYAASSLEIRAQLGRVMPHDEFPLAIIAAHLGRIDEARTRSQGASARAEAAGIRIAQSGHAWVLGFVELSLGDATAALPHLRRSFDLRNAFMHEPGMRVELGDLLEALVATGELQEADAILATWEARAGALDRAWALAILARCRALLVAARGDLDGALACFERSIAEHARDVDPFSRARTLLAQGRTQRRAKKRGAARATLESALAEFERLGAQLWVDQTRAELARIGGRVPSRDELTEAERRIAALVAEGKTNREVAAALFITERSVETALTRVYRKLGVRSRSELAHLRAANT